MCFCRNKGCLQENTRDVQKNKYVGLLKVMVRIRQTGMLSLRILFGKISSYEFLGGGFLQNFFLKVFSWRTFPEGFFSEGFFPEAFFPEQFFSKRFFPERIFPKRFFS